MPFFAKQKASPQKCPFFEIFTLPLRHKKYDNNLRFSKEDFVYFKFLLCLLKFRFGYVFPPRNLVSSRHFFYVQREEIFLSMSDRV